MATHRRVPIRSLETARLRLTPLLESDGPRIQTLFANPNVVRYMTRAIPWPYPKDGAARFLSRVLPLIEAREDYHWAIRLRERGDGGLMGVISLLPSSETAHRGFWLGEEFWGRGYMREATAAVNDYAFDELGMEELLLNNAAPNIASHRLKESAGAELLGIGEREYVGGTFPDVRWRLTAEAWRQGQRSDLSL